jgi:hypothetical protein
MQILLEIGQIFLTTYALALVMPIFWIVLFLVFLQYRRQAATEEKLFGRVINPIGRQMLTSLGLGALGGFGTSFILIFLGLSLEQIGLYFIWPVALVLLLINPRYLCFSYAGGIVAAAVLITRHLLVPLFPVLSETAVFEPLLRIHIPALLVLIGLLHMVEALLIYVGGHWGNSPIYLKHESGQVVGAFTLQRFWPLPLVALLVSIVAQAEIVGVSMPDWWPILQTTLLPGDGQSLQYMVIPVAAGLGYADMALTSAPRERSVFSAKWLALYSVILLVIAISSEYIPMMVLPGVIFAPIGHELLILYGKKREFSEKLLYRSGENGVPLMMAIPGTAAEESGLRQNDVISRINGEPVTDSLEMLQKIEDSYFMVLMEGMRGAEPFSLVLKKKYEKSDEKPDSFQAALRQSSSYYLLHRGASLGIIPVPSAGSPVYLEVKKSDPRGRFKRLTGRFSRLWKK